MTWHMYALAVSRMLACRLKYAACVSKTLCVQISGTLACEASCRRRRKTLYMLGVNATVTVIKLMKNSRNACRTSVRFCLRRGQSVQLPVFGMSSKPTFACTPASTSFLSRHLLTKNVAIRRSLLGVMKKLTSHHIESGNRTAWNCSTDH